MHRLLVGDESNGISVQVTICHPEAVYCHFESSDGTRRRAQVESLRINSAKDLQILRRPAIGGTLKNDIVIPGYRIGTT